MPPKVLAKPQGDRAGVLPVPASARTAPQKAQNTARLKLEIRRLPPNLTIQEFDDALGAEWRLGGGKVDWREFRQGKIKKSNKLPEMGRCYVHVTNENLVKEFEQHFLNTKFEDKAGTHKDRDIRAMGWLPQLGFAPNQRVPAMGRTKADQRQGTIDQDPEFMAFLEGETQAITKAAAIDTITEKDKEVAGVKSTPLINDLREKKARAEQKKKEAKEGGGKGKHARGESKDTAPEKDGKNAQAGTHKAEQATRGAAKATNKQVAGKQAQANAREHSPQQAKTTQTSAKTKKQSGGSAVAQSPKTQEPLPASQSDKPARSGGSQASASQRGTGGRQRGNADGIKKMLQKDLGIRPKTNNSQAQQSAAFRPETPASSTAQPEPTSSAASAPPSTPQATESAKSSGPSQAANKLPPTKAYLKHANPSQGITEILLQTTLSQMFGQVTNVTIDPRKGTAIAVFQNTEDLKKAIDAKKVQVAGGAIEVMEWKERGAGASWTPHTHRGGYKGGRGGHRGGRSSAAAGSGSAAPTAGASGAAAS